jgi:hypothetical protein
MGQHVYLEMNRREIATLPVRRWQRTILRAMADYGMFVGDTGGSGWGLMLESGSGQTSFGRPDPWIGLSRRLGLPAVRASDGAVRYVYHLRGVVDWPAELRIAHPCVSRGAC